MGIAVLACYITEPAVTTMNYSERVVNMTYGVPLCMASYSFHALSKQLLNIQTRAC